MTAKEFGKAMQMMLEGWANTPVEALDAVFTVTEDGRTFADDCLNPPLVAEDTNSTGGTGDETKEESHAAVPAEDTVDENLREVKTVLDGIACTAIVEGYDTNEFPFRELAQLYRTLFNDELITEDLRKSLVA